MGLRHVEVIAKVLNTDAAGRLAPAVWAEVETILAGQATELGPAQLQSIGTAMVDRPPPRINLLHMHRHRGAPGGRITGRIDDAATRMLACGAAVIPIVMNGKGQPLDVGRLTRVIPDGIRRAVAARDGGCARCGRPPSWCEIHHVLEWECDGPTCVENCVMLCRPCHRLIHHSGWEVRMDSGRPGSSRPAGSTWTEDPGRDRWSTCSTSPERADRYRANRDHPYP